eukprot:TRINITY_DN8219_c0_g1_i1.p1 TRINITY_DN8219_c0_g1~~TRINITY_DN8219_c0_g1_i1.p1  ORF type:complete len:2180 (+),score=671.96 TRINITY_DN8219_c0_g1_i1:76-6615(+)
MEDYLVSLTNDLTNFVNQDVPSEDVGVVRIGDRTFHGKSLMLFKTHNVVRAYAIKAITHPMFDNVMLVLILINAVFIALDDPLAPPDGKLKQVIDYADLTFLALFSGEVAIKILAMGFTIGKHTYLHDAWNVVDFVIVASGVISNVFHGITLFSILRIVRVFRPLRSINRIAGMRRLVNTLVACLPLMLDVVMLFALIFYLFSLVGVVMWHDSLHHRCWHTDPDSGNSGSHGPIPITDHYEGHWGRVCGNHSFIEFFHAGCPAGGECLPNAPPPYAYANFDNLGHAALVVFQSVTLDGWITHAYAIEDGWSPLASIFFIFLTLFGAFFVANLVLAVVTDALSKYTMPSLTASALQKHVGTNVSSTSNDEDDDASTEVASKNSVQMPYMRIAKHGGARATNRYVVHQNWERFVHDISNQAVVGLHNIETMHHGKGSYKRRRASTVAERRSSTTDALVVVEQNESPTLRPRSSSAVVKGEGAYVVQRHHSTMQLPVDDFCPVSDDGWYDARSEMHSRFVSRCTKHAAVAGVLAILCKEKTSLEIYRLEVLPFLLANSRRRRSSVYSAGYSSTVITTTTVSEESEGWRHKLRNVCRSKVFMHGITAIIITNALIMAIEHYDMPQELEQFLEMSNFVITLIFLLETVIKIAAYGMRWANDKFNLFDAFVVLISLVELIFLRSKTASLFRVFRMFRVLRFLKLARSWKVLQKIIDMIRTSLSYIGHLILLIFLFVFIFGVLGRSLFSGKMHDIVWCHDYHNATACDSMDECEWRAENETEMCRVSKGWNSLDNTYRANFHSLWQSMIHVFQILTKDNWALLCFRLQDELDQSVVLYFVVILVTGSYLLFSMFVAILLVKLSENSEARQRRREKRRRERQGIRDEDIEMLSPSGSPTCGEPSPLFPSIGEEPKVSRSDVLLYQMEKQRERKERLEKRKKMNYGEKARERTNSMMTVASNGGGSSPVPLTFQRQRSNTTFKQFKKRLGDGLSEDGTSNCSFRTNKTKESSRPELKSAMKGSRHKSNSTSKKRAIVKEVVDSVANDTNLDAIDLLLLEAGVDECFAEDEEDSEEEWEQLEGKSFMVFSPNSSIRLWLTNIVMGRYFEVTVSYMIILNCIIIAINDNALGNNKSAILGMRIVDWVFTAFFSCEILCRSIVHGALIGEHSYLRRHRWNKLDFLIVVVSVLAIPIEAQARASQAAHQMHISMAARIVKTFRAFRPLRILVRTKRMKVVVGAFVNTIPAVFNVMAVAFVLYFIFGIAGVQMMSGAFRRCSDGSDRSRAECVGYWNATVADQVIMNETEIEQGYRTLEREWVNPVGTSFDNLGSSWVTLLQVAALSGWMDIMYNAVDSNGIIDEKPIRDNRPLLALFFVAWIFAGAFFVMNIFTGVVVDHFSRQKLQLDGSIFLTDRQEQSLRVKKIIMNAKAKKKRALGPEANALNKMCFAIVTHKWFPKFILWCVVLNVLLMGTIHDSMNKTFEKFQNYGNTTFTIIFTIEMLLEMGVNGVRAYLNFKWFRLDFFIVCISWLEFLIAIFMTGGNAAATVQLLRLGRAFRLLRHFKGLRKLLLTLYYSIPAFYNITSLLLLMFFIFSILGMALFEDVRTTNSEQIYPVLLSDKANFKNFPRAMFTLYRVATMDNWVRVVTGCKVEPPYCSVDENTCGTDIGASLYFSTFMICVGFVMMNLFIAIILENFRESVLLPEDLTKKMEHVIMFRETWATYDPQGLQFIPASQFVPLLHNLLPPIGLIGRRQKDILPTVKQLDFPITWPEQQVLFVDAIDAIGETVFDIKLVDSVATRKYLKMTDRMQLYQYGWTIAHWYACSVIQTAWRCYRLDISQTGCHVFKPPTDQELYEVVAQAVKRQRRDAKNEKEKKVRYPGEDAFGVKDDEDYCVREKEGRVMIRRNSKRLASPGLVDNVPSRLMEEMRKGTTLSTPRHMEKKLSSYKMTKQSTLPLGVNVKQPPAVEFPYPWDTPTSSDCDSDVINSGDGFVLILDKPGDVEARCLVAVAAALCCTVKRNPLWSPAKLAALVQPRDFGTPASLAPKGSFTYSSPLCSKIGPYSPKMTSPLGDWQSQSTPFVSSPVNAKSWGATPVIMESPLVTSPFLGTTISSFGSPSAVGLRSANPSGPLGGLGRADPQELLRRATNISATGGTPSFRQGSYVNPLLASSPRAPVSPPKRRMNVQL